MIDMSTSPYFDDYNEDKKFHRVLFRPTYAVQAREMTQQQTILQNQISRFGNHIFKNGAMVIPGQITFDQGVHYVKIDTVYDMATVVLSNFLGYKIQGLTSGIKAEVINVAENEGDAPKTLFVKYLDSGTLGYQTFIDGEILQRVDNPVYECKVEGVVSPVTYLSTGLGSAASIEKGVYYINGFFVNVDKQSIILEKYDSTPSVKVGLKLYEYLITSEDDSSLTDNAQGSYNYAAPGADRYKLELLLEYIGVTEDITEDFIELQRIESGIVVNEIRTTEYNELEKTFARRTYDESGDYTVIPFNINIKEHLKNSGVPRFADGKYNLADGGDETKIAIGIEPGKAYVRGFERLKLATTWVETNKARTVNTQNNAVVNFNIGNYIYVKQCFMIPDCSSCAKLSLWDTVSTDGNTSGSLIGYARVRGIELVDYSAGAADGFVYKLYLFDINLNAGKAWNQVLWISDSDPSSQFTCNPTVGGDYNDVDLQIIDSSKKTGIFKLPHSFVKTLKPSGSSDTTYTVQRVYPTVNVVADEITLSAGADSVFDTFNGSNYVLMDLNAVTSAAAFIEITGGDVSIAGSSVTISGLTGITNVRMSAPVIKQVSLERTKSIIANKTFVIPVPNKIPGLIDKLDRADGYRLVSVIQAAPSLDITDRYTFEQGQKDSFYDLAGIKLKAGEPAPASGITVTYDYYSHTSGDYCSVDSYSSIDYYDIPAFYSEDTQYDLSDCVDFRPVIDSTGDAFTGTGGRVGELPLALSNIRIDYEHYLPRIDKLYIDYTGKFSIIEGNPAIYPTPPKSPSDGMVLYEIRMNAYTYSIKDVKAKFIDNKRYTMRDIGKLEKRINNLEYYTTLSLLEKDTAQYQIQDSSGFDRFKNGFIVEPFKSHAIGDSLNNDYKCSIDPVKEIMRPTFSSDSIQLEYNSVDSVDTMKTGPLVTLPYSSVSFISQGLASTTENVNPFAIRLFEGKIAFQPDSDNWYDTFSNGDLVVNDDAHYEALEFIGTYGKGLNGIEWNDWQTIWSGSSSSTSTSSNVEIDRSRPHDTGQVRASNTSVTTVTVVENQKRTGSDTTHTANTVNKFIGDRTVGINYIPYMRALRVLVKVEQMKPLTRVYPFFDDISVIDHCTPSVKLTISSKTGSFITEVGKEEHITTSSGGDAIIVFQSATELFIVNWNELGFDSGMTITGADSGATAVLSVDAVLTNSGDDLYTDDKGRIALVFIIPNSSTLKFRTGERQFILSDQVNNTESNQTRAEGTFKSQGSMLEQEGTVLSTKTIRFNRIPLEEERTLVWSYEVVSEAPAGDWFDPLAQTFLIQEAGGCFVTKCNIYFQKKDETLPISFQIREVVNGYPGQVIVPYSEVVLYPDDVNISEDGTILTSFNMQAPVYLQQGSEYCFVLLSDSFEYNVWVAEMGQLDVFTNEMISKQPYNGVLFKSQNASTWTANQDQDLKFELFKARFEIETSEGSGVPKIGNAFFNNVALTNDSLNLNPLETFLNSESVRVHQFAHGFVNNSFVTISGVSSGSHNGIPHTELNGTHIVTNVEIDSYVITVTTVATDSGITGGSGILASRNIQVDVIRPNISELVLPETFSSWGAKTCTHKSINGTQTPYQQFPSGVGSYAGMNVQQNNFLYAPMQIASQDNETALFGGKKSLVMLNLIQSDNRNLSPVIDLNRTSCITIANRIDSHELTSYSATGLVNTTNGSKTVIVTHVGHGMATGAVISSTASGNIGGILQADLTDDFYITRISDDSYSFEARTAATGTATGTIVILYCATQYKYVPESFPSGGSVGAAYLTRKIMVNNPSVAVKILMTAVVMDKAEIEIWYRAQGPYDTSIFSDLEYTLLPTPDVFVALSLNEEDFKDYEFTKEFTAAEEFTSIQIKVVMKSTESTRVPILDNIRVICLGT